MNALRANGAVVNTAIAIACAEGIVRSKDSNLLSCNGGHISLSKHWGKHLLSRMGYVKRRASTKAFFAHYERLAIYAVFEGLLGPSYLATVIRILYHAACYLHFLYSDIVTK